MVSFLLVKIDSGLSATLYTNISYVTLFYELTNTKLLNSSEKKA